MSEKITPIDVVITWVDGDDPEHKSKRRRYSNADELVNDDVGGDIRFTSIGEIKYCVASILRFAPFVRKIFIVTDNQDPGLDDFLDQHFPDRKTEIHIVDHRVIYKGYESCLPVFNSLSIETMLWRIPGLSDHFVYFNDDVLLSAPVQPEDFFVGNSLVCYASRRSCGWARFLRWAKHLKRGHKTFGFKDAMLNAADKAGISSHFLNLGHTPHIVLKDILESFYKSHPEALEANMKHRFREPSQFNPQELCYLLAEQQGRGLVKSKKGVYLYIYPKNRPGYVDNKLRKFDAAPDAKFLCINSISNAKPDELKKILDWLDRRLQLA